MNRGMMGNQKTVSINGRHYDPHTGLPIEASESIKVERHSVNATAIHQSQQKSTTLNRRVVGKKKPIKHAQKVGRAMDIAGKRTHKQIVKSPAISRFAKDPSIAPHTTATPVDVPPVSHPVIAKAEASRTPEVTAPQHTSHSHAVKQQAIAKALAESSPVAEKRSLKSRFPRLVSVGSASLAVLLIAGYLTYLNMPAISIRVAAAQSGIDASYPSYHPNGYSLSGPIAWNDGSVSMRFAANAGPQNFTINEQKSTWDSSAVLENYVQPKAGSNYTPQTQNGLTIYTFDNNAVWVNGGILYSIEGDAPLSNEQILHIATSL